MNYKESSNRKVYNIDFDGTLTTGEYTDNPDPKPKIINKSNDLYMSGNIVIIWTARWWDEANFLIAWLIAHKVKFHGIMMGKGGSDFYIDDKAINTIDFSEGKH